MNSKSNYRRNVNYIWMGAALFFLSVLNPELTIAQCQTDMFLNRCAPKLGSYNYLKSFASGSKPRKKSSKEITYVFSKGSTYIMIACSVESQEKNIVLSLFDMNHNLIASTFDEKTKTCYTDLVYPCSATGVYYIKIAYENSKPGCGMCILGFNRAD